MGPATRHEFLDLLRQSNLLTAEQLHAVEIRAGDDETARVIAKRLVEQKLLTKWQAQQLLAGRTKLFLGRYKLLETIGEGGMGAVYKAEQAGLNRIVAIKVMSREILRKPEAVTRFLREIRSAAALNHPNIVAAYDADKAGNVYFLVMEYVPGKDLKAWMKQHGPLPIAWSCEVIRQAALGLQHAYENGLVHRDIKPGNLLLLGSSAKVKGMPHVKILDMGLSRFVSELEDNELTKSGQVLGTPDYMAPEQALETRTADTRADIFSLGCTLFQMLSGRLPWEAKGIIEKLAARTQTDAPPIRTYRPDIPPELEALLVRTLSRKPDRRHATPAAFAAALLPFALGETSEEAPAPVPAAPPEPVTSGSSMTLEPRADETLNVFLNDLGNQPASATGSSVSPIRSRRPAASTMPPSVIWAAAGGGVVLVVGLIMALSGSPQVNSPAPSPATSMNTASAATPSVAPESDPPAEPEEPFEPMFNETDLTGWTRRGAAEDRRGGAEDRWVVEEGIVKSAFEHEGKSSYLITDRSNYSNFVLRGQFKINAQGYGDLRLRCGKRGYGPDGYVIRIPGHVNNHDNIGSLSPLDKVRDPVAVPDLWFDLEVVAEWNHIIVRIDGKTVQDCKDPEHRYTAGHIALQSGNGRSYLQVRNLEIRRIKSAGDIPDGGRDLFGKPPKSG